MADDKKPLRQVFAWVVDKLRLNHPPPPNAPRRFPERKLVPIVLVPGGMAPGGTIRQPRPDPANAADKREAGGPGEPTAEPSLGGLKEVFEPAAPAKDPAHQKLQEQAELRRADLRKTERECSEGQRRDHAEALELLREKLATQGKSGILRFPIEQQIRELEAGHASEVETLGEYFAMRWASTEAAIATALEVGHFSDAWATAETRAASRAAEHETGRGDDDGGRGMGD
jgi:hypothetical protein